MTRTFGRGKKNLRVQFWGQSCDRIAGYQLTSRRKELGVVDWTPGRESRQEFFRVWRSLYPRFHTWLSQTYFNACAFLVQGNFLQNVGHWLRTFDRLLQWGLTEKKPSCPQWDHPFIHILWMNSSPQSTDPLTSAPKSCHYLSQQRVAEQKLSKVHHGGPVLTFSW